MRGTKTSRRNFNFRRKVLLTFHFILHIVIWAMSEMNLVLFMFGAHRPENWIVISRRSHPCWIIENIRFVKLEATNNPFWIFLWISKISDHFSMVTSYTFMSMHNFIHNNYLVYDLLYHLLNFHKKFLPTQFRIEIWRQSKIKSILVRFHIWHKMISDC